MRPAHTTPAPLSGDCGCGDGGFGRRLPLSRPSWHEGPSEMLCNPGMVAAGYMDKMKAES